MQQYGKSKKQRIRNYLLKNSDSIFYLEDTKLYQELEDNKTRNQLCLLQIGMVDVNPFRSKNFKFETIGAIQFENRKMMIHTKEGVLIKIYNSRGIEKTEGIQEVKPRDFVLIRGTKEDTYSFNLYEVVSRHTRNQAIRIIWTDLKKGQKSNKYIDRLPYQYKKMISDNVN